MLAAPETRRAKLVRRISTNGGDATVPAVDEPSSASCMDDGSASDGVTTSSGAAADNVRVRSSPLRLVPIVPVHEILPGAMDINMDRSQLVCLAPLTSVKKEIYRSKHKTQHRGAGSPENNRSPNSNDRESTGDARSFKLGSNARSPSKHRVLASLDRAVQPLSFSTPTHALASNPLALQGASASPTELQPTQTASSAALVCKEDEQLALLKQKVRLLPISDSECDAFWKAMKTYQRLQLQYHKSLLHNQSTPMGFNMEAAWSRTLYEEQHRQWTEAHESRVVQNRERKAAEDEAFERKVFESTTEYRAQMRMLREVRARLQSEAQTVLPTVMLCAFMHKLLGKLMEHWAAQRLQIRLRGIVCFWRTQRALRSVNAYAALVLIHWLQKSIAVKPVAFKVFRGIRTYVRRVKKLQLLWRVKAAKRELHFRLLERLWIEHETALVDAAAERHKKRLIKVRAQLDQQQQQQVRKTKKPAMKKHASVDTTDMWLTFVDASIRTSVIRAFLCEVERAYVASFRQQETELFPQLVQTLRCEQPHRARGYVRVIAANFALLGRVHTVLQQFPGAVDDVPAIVPFDVRQAPDNETAGNNTVQTRANDDAPVQGEVAIEKTPDSAVRHDSNVHRSAVARSAPSIATQQMRITAQSYALVVVSCAFRHLPSLAEKTKEVAASLFHALVDASFSRFARRGLRLLVNPSVIEFQDTMAELQRICEHDSSFFLCLSSHGARVTKGVNEGSYVLFSESRLSSEDELLLTAIHENELARLIHAIPSRDKLVAVELCHLHEPKEQPPSVADSIRSRVHEQFSLRLHKTLVQMQQDSASATAVVKDAAVQTNRASQVLLLDACNLKTEVSLSCVDDGVSTFLHRMNDAFRGAAVAQALDEDESVRRSLSASEVVEYVCSMVRIDAERHNARVKDEYMKQVRTRYERVAEFQDITQTPQVIGKDTSVDFGLGVIPACPTLPPTPPTFVSSTLHSISIAWSFAKPGAGVDIPIVLGYHVQYCGSGRAAVASECWKRASSFQVLPFEAVVREKQVPPVTIRVFGLETDAGYCFRVRARSAGGWGPFSAVSPAFRTSSYASVHDQYSTVERVVVTSGAQGVLALMKRHADVCAIQQHCIEALAKLALHHTLSERPQLLPSLDMPTVHQVCTAMTAFKRAFVLQRHASLFTGRLCVSSDEWRRVIRSCRDPDILALVLDIARRFETLDVETHSSATWASARIRGDAVVVRQSEW